MQRSTVVKGVVFLVIAAVWSVMMFLLAGREGLLIRSEPSTSPASVTSMEEGIDSWRSIYVNDKWIGYVHTTSSSVNDRHYIKSASHLRFRMYEEVKGISITSEQEFDNHSRLLSFNASVSGIADVLIRGTRTGTRMNIDITYNRMTNRKVIDIPDDLYIDQNVIHLLGGKSLRVGDSYSLSVFNPLSMTTEKVVTRAVAVEGDLTVIESSFGGMKARAWIDGDGAVVREETPNGWVLVKETAHEVGERLKHLDTDTIDILSEVSVTTARKIPTPRQVRALTVRVSGIDLDEFDIENARQRILDRVQGVVEISVKCPGEPAIASSPGIPPHLDRLTKPSTWIDSDDPSIQKAAQDIVRGSADRWEASRRINAWVFENLEKTMTPTLPVASIILKDRKGDCNEHASLFVALARAAGIPAEMSAGLVYVNDGFYYHAWPKVHIGGWIHLDPTLGQDIADATHVELVSGDVASQARIALAMGAVMIEVLDVVYEPEGIFCPRGGSRHQEPSKLSSRE